MSESNIIDFTNPSSFVLLGIPGLEATYVWISIPVCIMYSVTLLGNFTILSIVRMELSLHIPMYYFVCMLAVCNLIVSTSIMPKILSVFWFNSREIGITACFTQQYFINCFLVMESAIITALAFEPYVAICYPLRHSTILTNSLVVKIVLASFLRGSLIVLPHPILARRWLYCTTNISHTYCEHATMMNMVCTDTRISRYYDSFTLFSVNCPDMCFIIFSYVQIFRVIFSLPTKEARQKTFGTCGSHLSVLLTTVIPSYFNLYTYRFDRNVYRYLHIINGNMLVLLPRMLNPIIYGLRTRQIRDRLLSLFTHKGN